MNRLRHCCVTVGVVAVGLVVEVALHLRLVYMLCTVLPVNGKCLRVFVTDFSLSASQPEFGENNFQPIGKAPF